MTLTFNRFGTEHFAEYRLWYNDPDLNRALGPLDQEWLDCVTGETEGCEYAVSEAGELIAVVGIKFPMLEHTAYVITDIAVKPPLRRKGIGGRVLEDIIKRHPCKPGQSWIAFVDKQNSMAKGFLQKQGWTFQTETPNEDGMIEMKFTEQDATNA